MLLSLNSCITEKITPLMQYAIVLYNILCIRIYVYSNILDCKARVFGSHSWHQTRHKSNAVNRQYKHRYSYEISLLYLNL